MVISHACGVIRPEGRGGWFELLSAVTPPSPSEDAGQSYVLNDTLDTPDTFIFVEERANLGALCAHFHSPHFTEFFVGLGEVLAEQAEGTICDESSTRTLDEAFSPAGIGS